jgi:pilus assembly protein Flp/PilA
MVWLHWIMVKLASERGQTMTEYGILIAWIVLLVIVGATKLGGSVSHLFSSTAGKV